MKYDFIQTLSKYKSLALGSEEAETGKFKAQVSEMGDGKHRMVFSPNNTNGDLKFGSWVFSNVEDVNKLCNSSNYS